MIRMMRNFLIGISLMGISPLGMASEMDLFDSGDAIEQLDLNIEISDGHKKHKKGCPKAKLTDDQKKAIHETMMKFQPTAKELKAKVKEAHQAYVASIINDKSTKADATKSAAQLSDQMSTVFDAVLDLQNTVLFDIAKPEQRPALLKCMANHHKKKGHKKQPPKDHDHKEHD